MVKEGNIKGILENVAAALRGGERVYVTSHRDKYLVMLHGGHDRTREERTIGKVGRAWLPSLLSALEVPFAVERRRPDATFQYWEVTERREGPSTCSAVSRATGGNPQC